jgi:hippurate hydrolase
MASLRDFLVSARRTIHTHPECGLDNPVTQGLVHTELARIGGLDIRSGARSSSVVAVQDSGRPGPTVVLRADTDALPVSEASGEEFASRVPGVSHSCGHDAHTAMLLGAARLLAGRRETLTGRVVYVFQPGEEGYDGAKVLLGEGLLDDVAEATGSAFALHITPNLPLGVVAGRPGTLMASTDGMAVRLVGRGGHAGTPELAVNPVPAAGDLALRLSTLEPGDGSLLTVTSIQAGSTHNVIPGSATVLFTLRCLTEDVRAEALRAVDTEVTRVAEAYGLTADREQIVAYPCTVNDPRSTGIAASAAAASGLHWIELPAPVMTAEDFSYFLHRWPGCMVLLGACPADVADPATAAGCHSPEMRLNESALGLGAALHASFVDQICGHVDAEAAVF